MEERSTFALERTSSPLYRQAAEVLRKKILTGEFPPGSALPSERDLSEMLGVSRIPIREALKALEYVGIVQQVRGKGVIVQTTDPGMVFSKIGPFLAPPSVKTLEDLFDIRILIEQYSARLAAEKATPEDVERLARIADEASNPAANESEVEEDSNLFHLAIAEIAGNSIAVVCWHFFSELLGASRRTTLGSEESRQISTEYHRNLVDAIRNHDGDRAASLMREHLENARSKLRVAQAAEGNPQGS